ncbi:hypothetical protein ASPWEDRAFT_147982 [Aspergillus wentii DTO 134E9]|uniref:AB hydrolase-1 domain-containing protein n=1 Tax=Aspergillus wentii DTO 134E9 TaxID=1073089 RepID=A0A1L9S430_ASPWE|nr:uncharacterized protein ASPWEDRAFT_147982 [Aspergillus wentii DTO 134E9]OJJ41926.1 hypothetical protein ASPWEDRAFT_147982 [Aspergillus wentii DTO 134E9]
MAFNFCAFYTNRPRIGHLQDGSIQPLAFSSGTPLDNLYQVIQAKDSIIPSGDAIPLSSVTLLPPISGRDILAVGKNYTEHAAEFNRSGYDSSDKVDLPSHPVIFTKRATSIVSHGHPIAFDASFTQTLDYEGELGVIIGKAGRGIKDDAMDYVWGYTIINDVTARERQRDHKQFYIGKSGDTYCPMGPVAVPASQLPDILTIQTFVNGEERQKATTDQLIFSIPTLIQTLSGGITLQPGDVIATGTPAGVGFGQSPPVFLQAGDEVKVSITGLGSLLNPVIASDASIASVPSDLTLPLSNARSGCLTSINNKSLYYKQTGQGSPIVFIHGLGGSMEYFSPLIASLQLDQSHQLHLADLEGHGLSPTSPLSTVTIESLAVDVKGVYDHAGLSKATLVAHSMGCIVALQFALLYPDLIEKLVLIGPPPNPLPDAAINAFHSRAGLVREQGMTPVVDAVVGAGTSAATKSSNPLAVTAVRLSLLGTHPEGYAKACTALAGCQQLPVEEISCKTLIITGEEDKVSPATVCASYAEKLHTETVILKDVGHWHVFEDVSGVSEAIRAFL